MEQLNEQQKAFNYFGDVLSLKYNECGLAAGELNLLVQNTIGLVDHELQDQYALAKNRKLGFKLSVVELRCIGYGPDITHNFFIKTLRSSKDDNDHQPIILNDRKLVLAQEYAISQTEEEVKTGYFKKGKSIIDNVELNDLPFLAVMLDEDTIMPFASFSNRAYGECSFVKLGSEMTNDAYFVVSTDEADQSRFKIVESIRNIIAINCDLTDFENIETLVNIETEKHLAEILITKERYVARKAYQYFRDSHNIKKQRSVLNLANNQVYETDFVESSLFGGIKANDGSVIKLCLGIEVQNSDKLTMYAVTAANLVLPLVNFNTNNESLEFEGNVKNDENAVTSIIMLLADRFDLKNIIDSEIKIQKHFVKSIGARNSLNFVANRIELARRGLLDPQNREGRNNEMPQIAEMKNVEIWARENPSSNQEIVEVIENYLENPYLIPVPYDNVENLLQLLDYRVNHPSSMALKLVEQFNIEERISEILPPTSLIEQNFLSALNELYNYSKDYILKIDTENVKIGKVNSRVTMLGKIEKVNTSYHLSIMGVPEVAKDQEPQLLLDKTFDILQPICERDVDGKINQNSLEEIRRILVIFDAFLPHKLQLKSSRIS